MSSDGSNNPDKDALQQQCPFINQDVDSPNLCTGKIEYAHYNYNPHQWVCALFVALFGLTCALHLFQALRRKRWYMLATIFIAALVELLGWSARLWTTVSLEWNPTAGGYWYSNMNAFLMQISTLIFAPAFLSAYWYIELGYIIRRCGPQYCRVTTKLYAITFICGDIASLVVQALGGGIASAAPDLEGANRGAKIMVGGVIVQMAVMIAYSLVLLEFVLRYLSQRPVKRQLRLRRTREDAFVPPGSVGTDIEKKLKVLIGAMVFSTVCIFVRSVYRTIELLDGWTGPIISDETLFAVLDGLMVFLAISVFNIIHPNVFFRHSPAVVKDIQSETPAGSENASVEGQEKKRPANSPSIVEPRSDVANDVA